MEKCFICNKKYSNHQSLLSHYEDVHGSQIPKDWETERFHYFCRTGKEHGNCVMCKQPTDWNNVTNKYKRFCNRPECKKKYKEIVDKRMINKHGKVNLLSDPDMQRKMMMKRKIAGQYSWSDGSGTHGYVGSYEKDFLQFLDCFLNFDYDDVMTPSPHTYSYEYKGERKFYIPDVYIPSLNLEIEIKDGGDNPNMHHKIQDVDKEKERLKDEVMKSQKSFNYIKITNKEYGIFFELLEVLKEDYKQNNGVNRYVMLGESNLDISICDELEIVLEGSCTKMRELEFGDRLKNIITTIKLGTDDTVSSFLFLKYRLEEGLKNAKSKDDCKLLLDMADNSKKIIRSRVVNDESLEYEANRMIVWIDKTYKPTVINRKNLLK